ncbi:MAG: hypothetical protein ABI844_01520 [Saprospiraceae bacterium]
MEIFVDGGLFEMIGVILFAGMINFIFARKYLLILYSALIIISPVLLFFINKSDLFYWIVAVCIGNGVLLVYLLWHFKQDENAGSGIIDVKGLKERMGVGYKRLWNWGK